MYICIYLYVCSSVSDKIESRAQWRDSCDVCRKNSLQRFDKQAAQPPSPSLLQRCLFFRTSHNLAKSGKFSRSALKIRITCFTTLLIPFDQKIIFGFRVDVIVKDILVLRDNDNYFWYKRVNIKNVCKCDNAKATCA